MYEDASLPSVDVCMLIPCYDNVEGLTASIKSIVYPAEKFFVLIVDDGSREVITAKELFKHLSPNVKIKIIRNATNEGITASLNHGLEYIYRYCRVKFIARLDCGDICTPDRITTQVDFLDNHPLIYLIGSWCYFKNTRTGIAYKYCTPTQHSDIRRSMYFRNVFIHPTVMWRFSGDTRFYYPDRYPYAEDYGLFYDIVLSRHTAIINKFLVTCEITPESISSSNRIAQMKSRLKVNWHYGTNKCWVMIGSVRLLLLMMLPNRFVYRIKNILFR